jgi:hypothetical protein
MKKFEVTFIDASHIIVEVKDLYDLLEWLFCYLYKINEIIKIEVL